MSNETLTHQSTAQPITGQPVTWKIDPVHSSVTFAVKHMMVATVRGSMTIADGEIEWDPDGSTDVAVRVRLDASSINTGMPVRDDHLRSPDFLDAASHPHLEFRATGVERLGEDRARLAGELTMRGVTRPVTLEVSFDGLIGGSDGRRAAFSATTTINREDWGLNWNQALESGGWLVSKEIRIELAVAAVEARREEDAASAA
jgi:polyisoprenoid-binding protein YceI